MLRLRDVKGGLRRRIWPPSGLPPEARNQGTLVGVRRMGDRLGLTILYHERDYTGWLDEWNPPPTIDQVEALLMSMLGKSIHALGEAWIDEDAPTVVDELGF
jgi:hypothetical protein